MMTAPPASTSSRHSSLELHFALDPDRDRTTVQHRHLGDLRILASLYPESARVCHQVLVHPPGGLVGGDTVAIAARVGRGAHALLTTPGATRFYRSTGARAAQTVDAHLEADARLEWLPLETLAYRGCDAENRSRFVLAPGAEMFAWDLVGLGLPASGAMFDIGRFTQHLEFPGLWLERGQIAAGDHTLLNSPGGMHHHGAVATLVHACGVPIPADRRDALLEAARHFAAPAPAFPSGATSPHPQIVVLRAIADRVEPLATLLRTVWAAWRRIAWNLPPCAPRIWAT